jgi:hypothetical protein
MRQDGPCQTHLPSTLRTHDAGMILPLGHIGCATGGGDPQSVGVHVGAGLHVHVWQPLASIWNP